MWWLCVEYISCLYSLNADITCCSFWKILKLALLHMCLQRCMHNRLLNGHSPIQLFRSTTTSTVANSIEMHCITYEIVYMHHILFNLIDHIGRWDSSALFYSVYNYGSSLRSTCTICIGCLSNTSTFVIWRIMHRIDFSLKKKEIWYVLIE